MPRDAQEHRLAEAERHRLLAERRNAGVDTPEPEIASESGSDEPAEEED